MNELKETSAVNRRTVLRGLGTVAVAGAVAGCSGDSGGGGGDGDGDGDGDGGSSSDGADGSDGSGDGNDGSGDDGSDGSGGVPSDVEGYLSETDNFDGSLADATGQSEVTVQVGTEANGGNFGFTAPAVRLDSGTTVVWEWTGEGASHNVVDEGGTFESELVDEEGHTFEYTFDETGVFQYFCTPHRSLGMKGAVVVE